MRVKRISKEPVKVSLPRRTKRRLKFRTNMPKVDFVLRSVKNSTHIMNLPNEVLLLIYSFLSPKDLYFNVRPVCRRWKLLVMTPTLWKDINVRNEISTGVLTDWIKSARLLKSFSMEDRNDANIITEELSKNCKQLETIKIQNCWGSPRGCLIRSAPLCNLVNRCRKLYSFDFRNIRFVSYKFFRNVFRDKRAGSVMKRYVGPINSKQMKALFAALCVYDVHDSATIRILNFSQKYKLRDIMPQELQISSQIVNDVWENLNYGSREVVSVPMQVDD